MSLRREALSRHDARLARSISSCTMFVTIQELEAAINYWRNQSPASGDALELCAEASALAKPYAMMIVQGSARIPLDVLDDSARSALKAFFSA
jgi:hypothetical protein